jgi:hypothetical protein
LVRSFDVCLDVTIIWAALDKLKTDIKSARQQRLQRCVTYRADKGSVFCRTSKLQNQNASVSTPKEPFPLRPFFGAKTQMDPFSDCDCAVFVPRRCSGAITDGKMDAKTDEKTRVETAP